MTPEMGCQYCWFLRRSASGDTAVMWVQGNCRRNFIPGTLFSILSTEIGVTNTESIVLHLDSHTLVIAKKLFAHEYGWCCIPLRQLRLPPFHDSKTRRRSTYLMHGQIFHIKRSRLLGRLSTHDIHTVSWAFSKRTRTLKTNIPE